MTTARTTPELEALNAALGKPPEGTRLVLMTDELFAALGADRVDWGEPDEHGWYSPTVYGTPDRPNRRRFGAAHPAEEPR